MQQSAQVIKEKNLEKLSQNALKMKELEFQMSEIEKKIESIKLESNKTRINEKVTKAEIEKLYQQTLKLYEEYNKKLKVRVNEKFVETFDEIAQRIYDSNIRREQLEDKKYELVTLIRELERISKDEEERDKKMDEDIDYLKSEYEFLRKNYDDITKENIEINKQITEKNAIVGKHEEKLLELKAVIGKLTEVRVILNKYFSSHFENFTQGEKKIIDDVKAYRITDEVKYKEAMNELLNSGQFGLPNRNLVQVNQSIEIKSSNIIDNNQPKTQEEEKKQDNRSNDTIPKQSKPPTPVPVENENKTNNNNSDGGKVNENESQVSGSNNQPIDEPIQKPKRKTKKKSTNK